MLRNPKPGIKLQKQLSFNYVEFCADCDAKDGCRWVEKFRLKIVFGPNISKTTGCVTLTLPPPNPYPKECRLVRFAFVCLLCLPSEHQKKVQEGKFSKCASKTSRADLRLEIQDKVSSCRSSRSLTLDCYLVLHRMGCDWSQGVV